MRRCTGRRGQPPLAWDKSCTEDQGKEKKEKKTHSKQLMIVCEHEAFATARDMYRTIN